MSDVISDGKTAVWFAPLTAFADDAAPTVAEMAAVTVISLEDRLTPDGLKINPSNDTVDTSALSSTFTFERTGRSKYESSLMFKQGTTPEENAWQAAMTFLAEGWVIIRRGVEHDTAVTLADKLEMYPVECGRWQPSDPAPNEVLKITVPLTVTNEPHPIDDPAVVAAGA